MIDLSALTSDLAAFLAPFLPYLLKAGEKAGEEIGKKFGVAAWDRVKDVWVKLRPAIETKPAALEAAIDVANEPTDEDVQAALRVQLRKLLAENEALAGELARLLEDAKTAGAVISSGERSVAIKGDVSGSSIITGDQNEITAK